MPGPATRLGAGKHEKTLIILALVLERGNHYNFMDEAARLKVAQWAHSNKSIEDMNENVERVVANFRCNLFRYIELYRETDSVVE